MLHSFGNHMKIVNRIPSLFGIFELEKVLVVFCENVCNAFIRFMPGCLLSGFFLISPLWLRCILHHRWTCSLQMISSGFPICSALTVTGSSSAFAGLSKPNCPLHWLQVWHLHSMLLSVCRRKSGLMSVSWSLTKQSVALYMRMILVEMVICSICWRGGKTKEGGGRGRGRERRETPNPNTATHWIHTPAGSSEVACLEAKA